jgi:cell division septation protein DedD
LTQQTQDDAFHEIQLNGKQLVFLFMAATVVSVVIFLFGVLVGRGVRAERTMADATPATAGAETTPQQPAPAPAPTPAGSDPTTAAPPPPADDLSYPKRLEKPQSQPEELKPKEGQRPTTRSAAPRTSAAPNASPAPNASAQNPSGSPSVSAAPASSPPPEVTPSKSDAIPAASSESGAQGFAVQIAAFNVRTEAEAIAKRLTSKGYAAYVLTPLDGAPSIFRVRVGKFTTRREAETIAAKLQKEEQLKPWVTR